MPLTTPLSPSPSEKLLGPGHGPGVWPLRERLALATALLDVDNQQASWQAIGKKLTRFTTVDRPEDWCSARACAKQYALLLDSAELTRRQKSHNEIQASRLHILHATPTTPSTPGLSTTERLVKRLTAERVDELRERIRLGQKYYSFLKTKLAEIQEGVYDTHLEQLCSVLDVPLPPDVDFANLESCESNICKTRSKSAPKTTTVDDKIGEFAQSWSEVELLYQVHEYAWICPPGLATGKGSKTVRSAAGIAGAARLHELLNEASSTFRASGSKTPLTLLGRRTTINAKTLGETAASRKTTATKRAAVATKQRYLGNAARNRASAAAHAARSLPSKPRKVLVTIPDTDLDEIQPAAARAPHRDLSTESFESPRTRRTSATTFDSSELPTATHSGASTPSTTAMYSSDTDELSDTAEDVPLEGSTATDGATTDKASEVEEDEPATPAMYEAPNADASPSSSQATEAASHVTDIEEEHFSDTVIAHSAQEPSEHSGEVTPTGSLHVSEPASHVTEIDEEHVPDTVVAHSPHELSEHSSEVTPVESLHVTEPVSHVIDIDEEPVSDTVVAHSAHEPSEHSGEVTSTESLPLTEYVEVSRPTVTVLSSPRPLYIDSLSRASPSTENPEQEEQKQEPADETLQSPLDRSPLEPSVTIVREPLTIHVRDVKIALSPQLATSPDLATKEDEEFLSLQSQSEISPHKTEPDLDMYPVLALPDDIQVTSVPGENAVAVSENLSTSLFTTSPQHLGPPILFHASQNLEPSIALQAVTVPSEGTEINTIEPTCSLPEDPDRESETLQLPDISKAEAGEDSLLSSPSVRLSSIDRIATASSPIESASPAVCLSLLNDSELLAANSPESPPSILIQPEKELAVELSPFTESDYLCSLRVVLEKNIESPSALNTSPSTKNVTTTGTTFVVSEPSTDQWTRQSHSRKRKFEEDEEKPALVDSPFVSLPTLDVDDLVILGVQAGPTPTVKLEPISSIYSPIASDVPTSRDSLAPSTKPDYADQDSPSTLTGKKQRSLRLRLSRKGSHMVVVSSSSTTSVSPSSQQTTESSLDLKPDQTTWQCWCSNILNAAESALSSFSFVSPLPKRSQVASFKPEEPGRRAMHQIIESIRSQLHEGSITSRPQFVHHLLAALADSVMRNASNTVQFAAATHVYNAIGENLTTNLGSSSIGVEKR